MSALGELLTPVLLDARIAALRMALNRNNRVSVDGRRLSVDEAAQRFAAFLITGQFTAGQP